MSEGLELAALNAPTLSVISGPESAIDDLSKRLRAGRVASKRLLTSHAFHSWMMEPALSDFRASFEGIELKPPEIPFIANVTGRFVAPNEATDPNYWVQQLRRPVRFSEGVRALLEEGNPVFVELGPGQTLSSFVGDQIDSTDAVPTMSRTAAEGDRDEQLAAIEALGRAWVRGAQVNWAAVDVDEQRQTVLLPTYPFQRHRYWVEPSADREPPRDYSAAPSMYEVVWQEAHVDAELARATEGPWLVFHDEVGLAEGIVARLREIGVSVASVPRTESETDLTSVLHSLVESNPDRPVRILHLGLVTGGAGPHNTAEAFDNATERGFYPFIALAQAAHRLKIAGLLHVLVVADSLVAIDGQAGELHTEKSLLFGPCRTIPQEIPGLSMKAVDIPLFEPGPPTDWLIDSILGEAVAADEATVVALRSDGRFVEGYRELAELPLSRMRLREGGTVLITGGVGGLGLKIAADLFDRDRANLALISRWAAPPRGQWEERAQDNDKIGRALRDVLSLEQRGAQVMIVTADVGNAESMSAAVERVRTEFGPVHGIVHAAGISGSGPALTKTSESAEGVFGAKVRGAFILEALFAETPLDFVVHFSSQATHLPQPGQVDYSGANSVLDALARRAAARRAGFHCSVGWGPWHEVGMAARKAVATPARAPVEPLDHPLVQFKRQIHGGRYVYGGSLRPDEQWVLDEHRLGGQPLMPGAAMIECVRAAFGDQSGNGFGVELSELAFVRPLFVSEEGCELEIGFLDEDGCQRFELRSRAGPEMEWTVHATGKVATLSDRPTPTRVTPPQPDDGAAHPEAGGPASVVEWGPHWDCIEGSEARGDLTLMHLVLPEELREDLNAFGVHPGLLDVTFMCTTVRFVPGAVPFSFRSVRLHGPLPHELFAEGRHRVVAGADLFDLRLVDGMGAALVEIEGYSKRPMQKGESQLGAEAPSINSSQPFRLQVTQPGVLSSLSREPVPVHPPGPGEVRIDVAAAGLNFRDVLSALGQLAGREGGVGELGSECSGRVSAVGEGVEKLQVGDAVVALASGALASHVTANAHLTLQIPRNLSFEEAAGIPIVFLTADYALNGLARLAEGERVLIHSATGGVGLAAVQLAQRVGAEVFGTAGSPEKRDYLREIGVEHVMDSRSLDFVEEIREQTEGEGVDVVLNALAGDFIRASIELLRPFGRFLEIGKRDIYAHMDLDLYPFHKNLAYFAIDLGLMMTERPTQLRLQFQDLMHRFELKELKSLPMTVFHLSDPAAGFEHLARANHLGKAVFKLGDAPLVPWSDGRDDFRERFGEGISVSGGQAALRRLLSSDEAPAHVLVLPRNLEAESSESSRTQPSSHRHRSRPQLSTALVPPSSPDEEALVQVWQDILGVAPIGVTDDFFQLGGNSMTALQLTYTAGQQMEVSLPDTAVFAHPTIVELAGAIRDLKSESHESDISEVLTEVESMSAEKISRLLDEVDESEAR